LVFEQVRSGSASYLHGPAFNKQSPGVDGLDMETLIFRSIDIFGFVGFGFIDLIQMRTAIC